MSELTRAQIVAAISGIIGFVEFAVIAALMAIGAGFYLHGLILLFLWGWRVLG